MRRIFSVEERKGKSVNGSKYTDKETGLLVSKGGLDTLRLDYIKDTILRYYPVPYSKIEETWTAAQTSMNEYLRRKSLNRSDLENLQNET